MTPPRNPNPSKAPNPIRDSRYRPIPRFDGYYVTRKGTIRSEFSSSILTPSTHRDGHLYHDIRINGKKSKLFVHRAVMLAWGPKNTHHRPVIRHLDGNPANNRIENLAWGTHSENAQDRERHKAERARMEKSKKKRRWIFQ